MASISVGLYAFAGGLVGVVALIRKEWLPYAILASVVVSAVAFNLNDSKEAPSVHTNAAKEGELQSASFAFTYSILMVL